MFCSLLEDKEVVEKAPRRTRVVSRPTSELNQKHEKKGIEKFLLNASTLPRKSVESTSGKTCSETVARVSVVV